MEVQRRFQELTGARLVEGYGLSEASPVTHGNPAYGENRVGTIGVPWPDTGERVKAFVVLKEGEIATKDEIIEFCWENLAPYKVPRFVEFRDELPKTLVGKILRRELAESEKHLT